MGSVSLRPVDLANVSELAVLNDLIEQWHTPDGSDGDATKALFAELPAIGAAGEVALNLSAGRLVPLLPPQPTPPATPRNASAPMSDTNATNDQRRHCETCGARVRTLHTDHRARRVCSICLGNKPSTNCRDSGLEVFINRSLAVLLDRLEATAPSPASEIRRYRMDIEFVHHALSGFGGEATVVPKEDPNGEWVKVATLLEIANA